jgi:hypothetical protein
MTNQPQFDVFLAHNSQDKPQVRAIARELKQRGLKYWIDEEQIPPGRSFQDVIQLAIPNVKSAAMFIGLGGLGRWQAMELRTLISRCVDADIPVIPVLLPGVEKIPEHLLFLKELNWVRFDNGFDDVEALDNLQWGISGKSRPSLLDPPHLELFTCLVNLLEVGNWRKANEATRTLILKVAGKENEGYLTDEQIQQFPSQVLHQLDTLWVNYSNGKFGFRVQKRIMRECKKDPQAFGTRVGWRDQDCWISASRVIYNPTMAPEGHLPWGMLQVLTMDNAALTAFVNTLRWGTKALAKEDWQRQLIADFMAFGGSLTGDKIDKEEFKRSLEYEVSHPEAWWEGQRIEELKVRKLFSLLVACQEL